MEIGASYKKHTLKFKFDAGTSRGVLKERTSYYIVIRSREVEDLYGIGECSPLSGLSIDAGKDIEEDLTILMDQLNGLDLNFEQLNVGELTHILVRSDLPSVRFGLETALLDLQLGGRRIVYDNEFSGGVGQIPINGLIWMGDRQFMLDQINSKIQDGYDCIKIKIGAIDLDAEISLLKYIRREFSKDDISLRLDANGAFSTQSALEVLERLAEFDIHSIEQPIKPGKPEMMREVCLNSPIPVALDEELIGIADNGDREQILQRIQPHYVILKPTLLGGLYSTSEWINLAEKYGIGWWVTSALESNIGLNAIAQFTAQHPVRIPQGLGTGQLYHNNIPSPLFIEKGKLGYDANGRWDLFNVLM